MVRDGPPWKGALWDKTAANVAINPQIPQWGTSTLLAGRRWLVGGRALVELKETNVLWESSIGIIPKVP